MHHLPVVVSLGFTAFMDMPVILCVVTLLLQDQSYTPHSAQRPEVT